MSAERLIEQLSLITALSEHFSGRLSAATKTEHYQPKQIIGVPGQSETRLWFIAEGLLRTYYFDDGGKEHTAAFYKEDSFLFSIEGFTGKAATYYIEVLESSSLMSISYRDIRLNFASYTEIDLLKEAFVQSYLENERLQKHLLINTAEERYHHIRSLLPWLFARVSIKLIATYLNMTRENLSRLMGRDL